MSQAILCSIERAVYVRTSTGLSPAIFCTCGLKFQEQTWEECGRLYDAHLYAKHVAAEEVKP